MGIIVQLVHQERLRPFQLVDPFGEELRPQTLARKELVKETKWLETSLLSLHPEYRSTTFQSIPSFLTSLHILCKATPSIAQMFPVDNSHEPGEALLPLRGMNHIKTNKKGHKVRLTLHGKTSLLLAIRHPQKTCLYFLQSHIHRP